MNRNYGIFDKICLHFDLAFRALTNTVQTTTAEYPAKNTVINELTEEETKKSAALMRINHAGEICAQALYHGQSIVSRSPLIKEKMKNAAREESDHLDWCKKRLDELNSHTSYLNPVWYLGSFCIGMMAGIVGDKWSLGFIAETETQVVNHLKNHLLTLPVNDERSQVILQKMQADELKHRDDALHCGAQLLPETVKQTMRFTSKIMVKTAYWI